MPHVLTSLHEIQSLHDGSRDEYDKLSDVADGGSNVGSNVGSNITSTVDSSIIESKRSGQTGARWSAFTAPPRYRNSGAFVHGTKFKNFKSIMEHGLRASDSDIFMIDEVRPDGRVPGLRDSPEILILIDENKARSENMDFEYDGDHGTWKTKGINGVIRPWFFQKVVDQRKGVRRGNVLFQSKEDPMMRANIIKGSQRPQYLIHATYWENVAGILRDGIVPAKNPTSALRRPFKELLQGAESHVYTISCHSPETPSNFVNTEWTRTGVEPEAVPEEDETMQYKLNKDLVGLDRPPDAFFVIDTQRAENLGVHLDMVQSADREENIFITGPVPPEVLTRIEANEPINLPANLKAKIVDPHSFPDIPIIDLRKDEATLVQQMQYACEVVGFMQIVGHGVSEELIRQHMELQKAFFNLPFALKSQLSLDKDSPVRGYFGKGGENLDQVLKDQVDSAAGQRVQQTLTDKKEGFDMNGVPWSNPSGGYTAQIFGKHSKMPAEDDLPAFRQVCETYSQEMFGLSRKLMSLMAKVLDKPDDFFEQYLTAPVATHRLLHYWPLEDFSTEIGVGAHTDYGLLTILKQDGVGGLQVLNAKDSKWIHCPPVDGAFVVNLGDMIGRWTAHRFKSTVHRVVNVSKNERFSVPYFLEPNMDTVIVTGGLCNKPMDSMDLASTSSSLDQHQHRCRLRKLWKQIRVDGPPIIAEEILERFYRASGQLVTTSRGIA